MSRLNVKVKTNPNLSDEMKLLRLTLANMLWENQFYVDGENTASALEKAIEQANPVFSANLALVARTKFKIRHTPLFILAKLAKMGKLKAADLTSVISRPDEIGEFLSIYWKNGKCPISNQVKKGLADSFSKFNEYQFAKWNSNSAAISFRDVMFLTHPTPSSFEQEQLFQKIANKQLITPDTWETQLSAGADKRETFTRLMKENKLGALAFLRNLRNMTEVSVSAELIREYAKTVNVESVLPFRFIAAANIVPQYRGMLEEMMLRNLSKEHKFSGKTLLLVDVSGSMFGARVSSKSDLDRFDAAAALAIMCREVCEDVAVYTFSDKLARVDNLRGFALKDAMCNSQTHNGTELTQAIKSINTKQYDRLIVFTDEADTSWSREATPGPKPGTLGYMISVAAYENGVEHKDWVKITGFSEAVITYIQALEQNIN